ncbi:hypothetical protein DERF_001700 [Dermatophagoides farinae]|uniref:Integrase catalytic domain-containing protein n=1 Tax=Dermatophagoides farinae TaxID=6954 RepID=A0A922L9W7_DERFA|nr:hypothetical protein DERF_001700 [Dermatophagoides farinae]
MITNVARRIIIIAFFNFLSETEYLFQGNSCYESTFSHNFGRIISTHELGPTRNNASRLPLMPSIGLPSKDICTSVNVASSSRCVVTTALLPRPKFDRLADRLASRDKVTMKDIVNAFVEEDEKAKADLLSNKSVDISMPQTAKMATTTKKSQRKSFPKQTNLKCSTNASSSSSSNTENSQPSRRMAKSAVLKPSSSEFTNIDSNSWVLNCSSPTHGTVDESNLINVRSEHNVFTDPDGRPIASNKIGDVIFHRDSKHQLILKNVAVGKFQCNLISVQQLLADGFHVNFDTDSTNPAAHIRKDDVSITAYQNSNGLWIFHQRPKLMSFSLRQKRLDHCGKSTSQQVNHRFPHVQGSNDRCDNHVSAPSSKQRPKSYVNDQSFNHLHIELWECPYPTCGDYQLGMLIVDHHSRFCFSIPLKSKSDATNALIRFIRRRQARYRKSIRQISTVSGDPFDNGVMLCHAVCTMLESTNTPHHLWVETMGAAIYLNNISVKDGDTSPYELFFGRSPSQYHYRSSGCVVNHQQPSSKCLSNRIYRNRSVDHLPSSSSSSSSSTFIRSVVSDSELNRIDSFNRIDRHDLGNSEWITVNRKSRKKQSSYYHSRKCL